MVIFLWLEIRFIVFFICMFCFRVNSLWGWMLKFFDGKFIRFKNGRGLGFWFCLSVGYWRLFDFMYVVCCCWESWICSGVILGENICCKVICFLRNSVIFGKFFNFWRKVMIFWVIKLFDVLRFFLKFIGDFVWFRFLVGFFLFFDSGFVCFME